MLTSQKVIDAINEQIGYEFSASLQYYAIGAHFAAEALPQLSQHFFQQAEEEAYLDQNESHRKAHAQHGGRHTREERPAEAELAPAALSYAEASYDTLAVQFGHDVAARVPLIVYASHTDFEQTNVLPFTPPEGLLGATDFMKRRVALPFRGNFAVSAV
jgi:hypothetical protein